MSALERVQRDVPSLKCKLFLFCSHPLAQEQFTHLLKRSEFDVVVTRELRLPNAALDTLDTPAGVAVIDASNVAATVEFVRTLRIQQCPLNLLVLLPSLDDLLVFPLLRLGVKGLLSYPQVQHELCRAARQVSGGGYWVPRELLTRFVESILPELHGCKSLDSEAGISRREREVLDLLLDNLSNKEIAGKLFVCERTVKFHVSNLLSKFGVQRRADLIVLWMQRSSAYPRVPREPGKSLSVQMN
jgi:two-component system, NarL family, response regulator DevR